MSEEQLPTGTIVVGVDGSPRAEHALDWAIEQAAAEHRPLAIVHALGNPTPAWTDLVIADPKGVYKVIERDGWKVIDAAHDVVRAKAPDVEVHEVLEFVDPRSLLLRLAERAEMIVVGSHGRGPVTRLFLGSVGVALARHATCPVVIHRPRRHEPDRPGILVAADGSPESRPVLEFAYHLADSRSLPLTVMHCYWDIQNVTMVSYEGGHVDRDTERLELAESLAGMAAKYPDVEVSETVAHGLPETVLKATGESRDLVVVGAHQGTLAYQLMFSSVSVQVVDHADFPVAVVPLGSALDTVEG